MINRVILVGRITKDLELKTTTNNLSVCTFTIAVNRAFKGKEGEPTADFVQCVVWRKQAENLVKYCNKGSMVGVDGRLQTRTYETGNPTQPTIHYVTEVVADTVQFLDSKNTEVKTDRGSQTVKDISSSELPF